MDDSTLAHEGLQAQPGMRHSIRPRRLTQQQTRAPQSDPEMIPNADKVAVTPIIGQFIVDLEAPQIVADPDTPQWDDLPQAQTDTASGTSGAAALVDPNRDSPALRAFDLLRTRLRQTTQENGWRNIAVCAPTCHCGNTFTAVNLALSLSRVPGSRTVLMDLNLRRPGIARALGLTPGPAMRAFLDGSTPLADHFVRLGETLALGLNAEIDTQAAETIQNPATAQTLQDMRAALQPEMVIYDLPAMLAHDDLSAFLPQLDGVLLVSDGTRTMAKQLIECERMLEGQVPLLGVVLNRARAASIRRYS